MNEVAIGRRPEEEPRFEMPSLGTGIMRSTTSIVLLLLLLEGDYHDRIRVLDSVLEHVEIAPELIAHYRTRPDCIHEDAHAKWYGEHEALRAALASQKG